MEFNDVPDGARLTWVVGPPGAGKTTFSLTCNHGFDRVVELTEILAPVIEPVGISKGVLQANGRLVEMIRKLELRPENIDKRRLLVVAGLVPEESVLPVRPRESVWLLLPSEERWRKQLYERPTDSARPSQYRDYDYAEAWYTRFKTWREQPGVKSIATSWDPDRLGQLPPSKHDTMRDSLS